MLVKVWQPGGPQEMLVTTRRRGVQPDGTQEMLMTAPRWSSKTKNARDP
jgi:hypothetical protein